MITTPAAGPAAAPTDTEFNATYVWLISIVAAMGGLLFGYDWIVISGTDLFYEAHFHLTSSLQVGWAKSSALLGCLIGALVSGALNRTRTPCCACARQGSRHSSSKKLTMPHARFVMRRF